MVVDDKSGLDRPLNWEVKNLTETRDYAVVTSHASEVNEIISCFEADWTRQTFPKAEIEPDLVCRRCPQRIAQFVDDAKHSLWVQNERYGPQSSSNGW